MALHKPGKKRIVTSIHNLSPEIQDMIKAEYPTGYNEVMMRIEKPNGDFFYAVPFATDEVDYLVKIDVKIDDKGQDDDDKSLYDDEESKDSDDLGSLEGADDNDDDM